MRAVSTLMSRPCRLASTAPCSYVAPSRVSFRRRSERPTVPLRLGARQAPARVSVQPEPAAQRGERRRIDQPLERIQVEVRGGGVEGHFPARASDAPGPLRSPPPRARGSGEPGPRSAGCRPGAGGWRARHPGRRPAASPPRRRLGPAVLAEPEGRARDGRPGGVQRRARSTPSRRSLRRRSSGRPSSSVTQPSGTVSSATRIRCSPPRSTVPFAVMRLFSDAKTKSFTSRRELPS